MILKYNISDRSPGDIDTNLYENSDGTGELVEEDGGFTEFEFSVTFSAGAQEWAFITDGQEWRIGFTYQTPPGVPPPQAQQRAGDWFLDKHNIPRP